jgi:hypothetical protein
VIYFQLKKESLPSIAFFSVNFLVLFFEYFSNRAVGTYQNYYRYYGPSLVIVLLVPVLLWTLNTEFPSNSLSKVERHECKSVVTTKHWRIRKITYFTFVLQMISTTSIIIILELWITLYIKNYTRSAENQACLSFSGNCVWNRISLAGLRKTNVTSSTCSLRVQWDTAGPPLIPLVYLTPRRPIIVPDNKPPRRSIVFYVLCSSFVQSIYKFCSGRDGSYIDSENRRQFILTCNLFWNVYAHRRCRWRYFFTEGILSIMYYSPCCRTVIFRVRARDDNPSRHLYFLNITSSFSKSF